MIENINWYPGHMKKTRELIKDNLKLVDLVIEVLDARIPISSRNPIIDELVGSKPRVIALNKTDIASDKETKRWREYFANEGSTPVAINAQSGSGVSNLLKLLERMENQLSEGKMRQKPLRMMIVGVPNVGKSSLINRLTGRKATQIGNKPGVTKGKQWLRLKNGMELLDTPGILWPKFEDNRVGIYLAFCGSIKDEILDLPTLALELIKVLRRDYPNLLLARYKLDDSCLEYEDIELLDEICRRRGYILPGKRIDYDRAGKAILDDFRSGKIGRITLEMAD
ncbi:MAG: ribosome biogenesis GTPase YlqF [Clostridiales bacterium]|nr:ribosome biogenesis GTPase YlqF [Clostridiales bacterium]MDY6117245.1 ribosome biogenesis GTPase YlqF [Anaerovoracaceae bacterium]